MANFNGQELKRSPENVKTTAVQTLHTNHVINYNRTVTKTGFLMTNLLHITL